MNNCKGVGVTHKKFQKTKYIWVNRKEDIVEMQKIKLEIGLAQINFATKV